MIFTNRVTAKATSIQLIINSLKFFFVCYERQETQASNETDSTSLKVRKDAIYPTISNNGNQIFVTYHPKFQSLQISK
jgi:hypothetical protein